MHAYPSAGALDDAIEPTSTVHQVPPDGIACKRATEARGVSRLIADHDGP